MTSERQGATPRPRGGGRAGPAGRASAAPRRPGWGRTTVPAAPVIDLTEPAEATVPEVSDVEVAPQRGSATRNRVTGRAAVLLLVLGMLGVAYAWPVREYIRQRGELTALRAATSKVQAKVDALEAAKARWADPAYVEAQARGRLHYVMPGEVAFTVVHPGQSTLVKTLPKTPPRAQAWYDALWGSVQGADNPAATRKP
jgi:cell division protein FtsB